MITSAGAVAYANAYYGQGSGPILLDNMACTGVENALVNCSFDNHTGDCRHSDDAGVRCYTYSTSGETILHTSFREELQHSVMKDSLHAGCVHGDIRLAGSGTSSTRGRVEVCLNNVWGSVCDDLWSSNDARVACRQLGYSDQCKFEITSCCIYQNNFEIGYCCNEMHGHQNKILLQV